MSALSGIAKWYRSQCNEEWEHGEGVTICTLDNPGWAIEVSLRGTPLEATPFEERKYGIEENAEPSGEDWLVCRVVGKKFKGYGGPFKLEEMIRIFLDWAVQNGEQGASNDGPAKPQSNSAATEGSPSVT